MMRKPFRKCWPVLAAATLMFTNIPAVYAEEEPTDFEPTDRPMIYNETDSDRLPVYEDDSGIHGEVDTSDAAVITSMFSDEAFARFGAEIDRINEFEPAADSDVASMFTKVENFISSGGITAYLEDGSLLHGSEIGLCNNRDDKVTVLGTESNASSWIYVVDKDATLVLVKDENGEGIPSALVTLSWLGEDGNRYTKSIVATDGFTPGIASFTGLPESFNGIMDIQAEGYHCLSFLDKQMTAGDTYTFELTEADDNELYVRGADLSGKDLLCEETDLVLVDTDTDNLDFKVLISRTGDQAFPSSLELYSETRGTQVVTISQSEGYEYDSNTRVYTYSGRWAEKKAGLLKADDVVSVRFADDACTLSHLSVEDAVMTPGVTNTQMPMTAEKMNAPITDRLGGAGFLNFAGNILKLPVSVGFYPDGTAMIMASYDITTLDKNTQYKFSSLFEKSWNPRTLKAGESGFEVFEKSFWENARHVKGGEEKLDSGDKLNFLTNRSYDFQMNFSVFLRSCWNKDTKDYFGSGGIIFSADFTGGVTEYFLFVAGPVFIPAYIGFEAGLAINVGLSLNFCMDQPPKGMEDDTKWKYATDSGKDLNERIDVIAKFSLFGGVGVKGVLGANATGYFNLDIAAVLGKGKASLLGPDPHTFIDMLYGLRFNYYLVFFSGSITMDCLNDAKRIYDSQGEKDPDDLSGILQTDFQDLSLASCADTLVPLNGSADSDPAYTIAGNSSGLSLGADLENVDALTYPDSQAQFVSTKNYTALFRIISEGDRTSLVYQLQDPYTGSINDTVYKVVLPEDKSVTEFMAVPNKTERDLEGYCDNVYIGAVLADSSVDGLNERAATTEVAGIVVNLYECRTRSSLIVSDPADKGKFLHSAPRPAGSKDYCAMAYTQTRCDQTETPQQLLEAMASDTYSRVCISRCSPDNPMERDFAILGAGTVFTTGAIAPNEPSFWMPDRIRSTDKTLIMRGYGSNGYYSEDDLRCLFALDISDHPATDFNYDPIITNWQYINGCNYFIAGDSIYWMEKEPIGDDPADYRWKVQKAVGGSGMINVDNSYAMITDQNQAAVYVVSVVGDYQADMETASAEKTANKVQIYTLITKKVVQTYPATECSVHGPLTLEAAYGEPMYTFTAAYNPERCAAKGLTLVYSTPVEAEETNQNSAFRMNVLNSDEEEDDGPQEGEAEKAAALRMWKQNAGRGLHVTDVKIPQAVIREGAPFLIASVTFRNYGYAVEGPHMYRAYDENGNRLILTNGKEDLTDDYVINTGDLYTGDTKTESVYIKPYWGWAKNQEHEIIIEMVDRYEYDGNLDDVVAKAALKADNTTLAAKNILIGEKHYVSVSMANNTEISHDLPVIKAVFDYADPEKEKTMTFPLPVNGLLSKYDSEDEDLYDQIYHYDIDMDQIWDEGLKEGLRGIYFSLTDSEDNQISNETIYLENPAEILKGSLSGIKTDEEGNPLAGASIGLFVSDQEEPLFLFTTGEDGTFRFSGLEPGDYILKETAAPEGYVLSETEYPVTIEEAQETDGIEITNRLIKGSAEVTLSDEDNPASGISGTVIAIYKDGQKIGELKETSPGVYTISDLPYGEYTLKVEKAPKGYSGNPECRIQINEDGAIVKAQLKLKKNSTVAPDTHDSSRVPLYAGMCLFALLTAAFVLVIRRKASAR